jgi:predicted ester cyclase
MDRIVNEHFGYEAADNVEGLLATLTDDVDHHVVGSPLGELKGKDAVRPMYERLFEDLKGESVQPVARWYGPDFVVDETIWTGHIADGYFFGLPGRSGNVTFRLLHVFELRDGLIGRENVWSDIVAIAEQTS